MLLILTIYADIINLITRPTIRESQFGLDDWDSLSLSLWTRVMVVHGGSIDGRNRLP